METISIKTTKKAMARINKVVDKKSMLPILKCIKIINDEKGLQFIATDLDKYLVETISFDCFRPINTCVNFADFYNTVKNFKSDYMMYTDNDQLVIECDGMTSRLETQNTDDYPFSVFHYKKHDQITILNEKTFINSLVKSSLITTKKNINKVFSGVLITKDMDIVATDIHRIIVINSSSYRPAKRNIVISTDTIGIISKIPGIKEIGLSVELFGRIKTATTELQFRTLKDEFPNYGQVVDKDKTDFFFNYEISVNQLSSTCKTMSNMYDKKTDKTVPLKFIVSETRLNIKSTKGDQSIAVESISPFLSGETACNGRYVADCSKLFNDYKMEVGYDQGLKPISFISTIGNDKTVYMIMPLRVSF